MYDILQLNDMLVPELIEIAEKLKVTGTKKLDKQGLVYKILDKQAVLNSKVKDAPKDEKGVKKKRIVKTTTANSTEEAIVESEEPAEVPVQAVEVPIKKIEKKLTRKSKDEISETPTAENEVSNDEEIQQPETGGSQ